MNYSIFVSMLLFCSLGTALSGDEPDDSGLSLVLHYSNGLTAKSTSPEPPKIVLYRNYNHIHLKISNTSKGNVLLWTPDCPEGALAMWIEFRFPDESGKVFTSRNIQSYSGGTGIAKTLKLAPNDDLIVNIDFLKEWKFPLSIANEDFEILEIRAVYESSPFGSGGIRGGGSYSFRDGAQQRERLVWKGAVSSPWEKVRVINRSGKRTGEKNGE